MSSAYDGRADAAGVDEAQLDSQLHDMMAMAHPNALLPDLSSDMMPLDLDLNDLPDTDPSAFGQGPMPGVAPLDADHGALPDSLMAGPGAGPLPASFGVQLPPNVGSTLTEFTKRRNWSQRVIEELKDFLHILTPDGRMIYVSPSSKTLTGYESAQLVGQFISDYIHPDDTSIFVREFNESIASGNPLRFFYRFRKPDNTYIIFESHGHPHFGSEAAAFGPNAGASFCRGFFMMARPYPTKNAALLDSFLEHKIENERLKRRIADLKREEQDEMENQQRNWAKVKEGESGGSQGGSTVNAANAANTSPDYHSMPPPAKPSVSNTALTRQNLNEALAASKPDSINDKMARYEGATHVETIEMLTGLRYREGERSKGISTGSSSPALIRGDAGIPIHVDKDGRPVQRGDNGSPFDGSFGDKKKKMKVADEYVCTDCGTLDSPEWRKGPNGPKTLCNACGLRWAKKEKKRSGLVHSSSAQNGDGPNSTHTDGPNSMSGSTPTGPVGMSAPQPGPQMAQMHSQMAMMPGMNPNLGMGAQMGNMPP